MAIRVLSDSRTSIRQPEETTVIFITNTMGTSVVLEVFKSASVLFIQHGRTPKVNTLIEARNCYNFIENGTGLEMLLEQYDLNYDADKLRDAFHWVIHHP